MARREPKLSDEEIDRRARARLSAEVDLAKYDLGRFIPLTTPEYDSPDHLRPLLDALDRSTREPVFGLVEAPPQHTKTETFLHHFARLLKYFGSVQLAYCAYGASLALRKSRRCRDMASRAGVWAEDEVVRRERFNPAQAVSYWQTIDGGSFMAGGRGGGFTGGGYDQVLCDDLLKNREEAESPVFQEKAIETIRSTFGNRINPGGSLWVTHQPWNDQDPIAQLKAEKAGPDGQDWELISLPAVINAEYDDDDNLIGGVPLWPARHTLADLAKIKRRVKPYNWHSQYTLERRPRGDRVFHEPARYATPQINGGIVVISCDPGIEEDKMKDSSGIVVGVIYRLPSPFHTQAKPDLELWMDVLWAEDRWFETPDLLDYLELLQTKMFPGAPVLLEEVSAFKTLSQVAKRLNKRLRAYAITPQGNKLLRAQPAADAWNEGHVRVPVVGEWQIADFIRECQWFTGRRGGKDNRVDALTQLYDYGERVLVAYSAATSGGEQTFASSPF